MSGECEICGEHCLNCICTKERTKPILDDFWICKECGFHNFIIFLKCLKCANKRFYLVKEKED
jgi:hypothetical protein